MVSIIIPVYKSEKTLERCIHSICKQTYEDWEAIMIVDGPPDSSGILAEALAQEDSRIRVIHQENQGVSVSRNAGIEAAKGTYIQFLDSDDYLPPDSLKLMHEAMENHPCDFLIGGFHHIYFGKEVEKLPKEEGYYILKESQEIFLTLYKDQFLNMPWNKWYKKELIIEGFPLGMSLGEDLLFNISYLRQVKSFGVIQKSICNYIQDDRGTTLSTKRRNDRIETAFTLMENMYIFCTETFAGDSKHAYEVLKDKLAVEFLDGMEELAFYHIPYREKTEIIQSYRKAFRKIEEKRDECTKMTENLQLLDYRIIGWLFYRNHIHLTYLFIMLRGIVVKLVRRIQEGF